MGVPYNLRQEKVIYTSKTHGWTKFWSNEIVRHIDLNIEFLDCFNCVLLVLFLRVAELWPTEDQYGIKMI